VTLVTEALLATFKNVPQAMILWMAMVTRLAEIAVEEVCVTMLRASAHASLAFMAPSVNTRPLFTKVIAVFVPSKLLI